ncbi:MAG: peptidoglycan-binding domain-containing protein [Gaiellaceae bacterium]
MSGRERPRRADPDDWFAGGDPRAPLGWGTSNVLDEPAEGPEQADAAEDWLRSEPAAASPSGVVGSGFTVRLGTLLAVGAALAVVIVLVGLELGGAFSNGGKHAATTASTGPSTTTTRSPSTTPSTTPTQPVLPAPTSTLKPGDHGSQVKVLQRALERLGYSVGVVDGIYGPSTKAALARFQKRSSLVADGVFGAKSLRALEQALARSG